MPLGTSVRALGVDLGKLRVGLALSDETGTIASTVTTYNAVMDALKPFGVGKIDMPLTPEKVWRAIQDEEGS